MIAALCQTMSTELFVEHMLTRGRYECLMFRKTHLVMCYNNINRHQPLHVLASM